VVSNRELFHTVGSTSGTLIAPHVINPGFPTTFPWLSGVANLYETYRFKKLSFEYVPSCGTVQAGSIILAVDFDVLDTPPTTKQEITSYAGWQSSQLYRGFTMSIPFERMQKLSQRWTRSGVVTTLTESDVDLKLYDLGTLYILTSCSAPFTDLGDLFVSYEVELITQQSASIVAGSLTTTSTATETLPRAGASIFGNAPFRVFPTAAGVSALQFVRPFDGFLQFFEQSSVAPITQPLLTLVPIPGPLEDIMSTDTGAVANTTAVGGVYSAMKSARVHIVNVGTSILVGAIGVAGAALGTQLKWAPGRYQDFANSLV
jgi:hypothetical protein